MQPVLVHRWCGLCGARGQITKQCGLSRVWGELWAEDSAPTRVPRQDREANPEHQGGRKWEVGSWGEMERGQ
jgi:hypothetical protein